MGKLVNKRELSEIIGVSQQTLTAWQKQDYFPVHAAGKKGTGNVYDTQQVIEWMLEKEKARLTPGNVGRILVLDAERARLAHAQANKTELEVKRLRGELLPYSEILQCWQEMIAASRAKLLALPTKIAQVVIGASSLPEIEKSIKAQVHEALSELSSDGIPSQTRENREIIEEYESYESPLADDDDQEIDGGSDGGLEPTTKVNGERVGRRRKKTKSRSKRRAGAVAH